MPVVIQRLLEDEELVMMFRDVSDDALRARFSQHVTKMRVAVGDMNMAFQEMSRRLAEAKADKAAADLATAENAAAAAAAAAAATAENATAENATAENAAAEWADESDAEISALEEDSISMQTEADAEFESIQETLTTTPEMLGLLSSSQRAEQARLADSICRPSSWY